MRLSIFQTSLTITAATGLCVMLWMWSGSAPREHIDSPASFGESLEADYSFAEAEIASIHFTNVQEASGIDFQHQTGNSSDRPFPAANGSGIGCLDYDLDGSMDLLFATGRSFPLDKSDLEGTGQQLYRNVGEWKFSNVAVAAGVDHRGYGAGVAVGDFDNDGFADIYLTCVGPNVLYHNRGDGTFESIGRTAEVDDPRWGTSAAFLDYDADGFLDLYACNYAQWTPQANQFCGDHERNVRIFCSPDSVPAERHLLFRNRADGTFQESLRQAGLDARSGRGQGVVAADINRDGRIDIYVTNDLQPNFLFLNDGLGRFRDATEISGAAYDKAGRSQAGMGVDAGDMNGDGLPELYVTNFEHDYNTLYENVGNSQFQDMTEVVGLAAASLPWVGWGTILTDFDGDGWRDVAVTNGHTDTNLSELGRDAPFEQPPLVWRNRGRRFEFISNGLGEYFNQPHAGRALACGDLDNDGDPDLVVGHQDGKPALLRNDRERLRSRRESILLRFIGRFSNRDAIGTSITMTVGDRKTYHQICGGRSYLSAHDLRVVETCGDSRGIDLEILWPLGIESRVKGLSAGKAYVVIEPNQSDRPPMIFELFRFDSDPQAAASPGARRL